MYKSLTCSSMIYVTPSFHVLFLILVGYIIKHLFHEKFILDMEMTSQVKVKLYSECSSLAPILYAKLYYACDVISRFKIN